MLIFPYSMCFVGLCQLMHLCTLFQTSPQWTTTAAAAAAAQAQQWRYMTQVCMLLNTSYAIIDFNLIKNMTIWNQKQLSSAEVKT